MPLTLVAPPAEEPISRVEAKAHLRLEHTADDDLVGALVVAARQYCEAFTGRALVAQTWKLTLPAFEECIALPKPPILSVESVKYLDADGVERTISADEYMVVSDQYSAALSPDYGQSWPAARLQQDAVRITFTAGYGGPGDVPQVLKQGMLLHLAQLYENREGAGALPQAVPVLYWPYRALAF